LAEDALHQSGSGACSSFRTATLPRLFPATQRLLGTGAPAS